MNDSIWIWIVCSLWFLFWACIFIWFFWPRWEMGYVINRVTRYVRPARKNRVFGVVHVIGNNGQWAYFKCDVNEDVVFKAKGEDWEI